MAGRLSITGGKNQKQRQNLTITSWSIWTLLDTALVVHVLRDYSVDIADLQESRFAGEGTLHEEEGGYTFFWSDRPEREQRESGVCLAMKNCLPTKLLTLPLAVNDWIQTLHIPLQEKWHFTIVIVYASNLTSLSEVKETFYGELKTAISSVATSNKLLLLGDFNAQVGREFTVWPGVVGCQGVSNSNSNGLLLLLMSQNSNCASLTQCSDCQTSLSAHGCILIQKAGISLTLSSLNKETLLMLESPGWSMELIGHKINKWCSHSFAYQSIFHTGWM